MSAPVAEAHIARARASGFSTDKGLQMAAQFIATNDAAKSFSPKLILNPLKRNIIIHCP